MGKGFEQRFLQEDIQMTNKYTIRYPTSLLVMREIKNKTTMKYYFTPTRMAIIIVFKKTVTSVDKDVENWNPYVAGENVKWYKHFIK